jgi:hypothetical protein
MNYEKKRKRQNGRQARSGKTPLLIFNEGFYMKQSQLLDRLTKKDILPPLFYNLKLLSGHEFKEIYPNE